MRAPWPPTLWAAEQPLAAHHKGTGQEILLELFFSIFFLNLFLPSIGKSGLLGLGDDYPHVGIGEDAPPPVPFQARGSDSSRSGLPPPQGFRRGPRGGVTFPPMLLGCHFYTQNPGRMRE